MRHHFGRHELSFRALTARVPNEASTAAHQHHRAVPSTLPMRQQLHRHIIANGETVGGGIEPRIGNSTRLCQVCRERFGGGLVQQAAPSEFIKESKHLAQRTPRKSPRIR